MSVPQGKRGENQLQIFIKAEELAVYTTRICSNKKTFNTDYYDALTSKIVDIAQRIYIDSWTANNVVVKDIDTFKHRRDLQVKAHEECNELLAYIQMAKRVYHLRASRIKYWSQLTTDCRNMIAKWKDSDTRRYNEYK